MQRPTLGVCSWSLRPHSIDDLIASLNRVGVTAVQLALKPFVEPIEDDWTERWGNGCALPNFPGVYARVASFTDYVHDMQRSLGPVYVNVSDATGLAGHAGSTFTINRTVARPLLDLLFPLSRL